MSQPVTIENDCLRLETWPTIGGKVSSLIDKADKFELLFNYPAELPTRPQYDTPFHDGWYGGWDECFPAVAPSAYPSHPYKGVSVPDHGELWGLPTMATPTHHGITNVWQGLRFGYRLTRQLELDGPTLVARYTLQNYSPFLFRFVWAMHPLFAMPAPVEIHLSDGQPMRLSHDAASHDINRLFNWPRNEECDFSRPDQLPPQRGWKLFSGDPITSPMIVRYPTRRRQLEISYASGSPDAIDEDDEASTSASASKTTAAAVESHTPVPAYWGLWINTGGWGRHRHFSIEPTTGRFDQIDRSEKDHSAGKVAPLGTVSWNVTLRAQPIA